MKKALFSMIFLSLLVIPALMMSCSSSNEAELKYEVVYQANLSELQQADNTNEVMESIMDVLEERLDAFGIEGAVIQLSGTDSIVVRLPQVTETDDVESLTDLLGDSTLIEFRKQDNEGNWIAATGMIEGEEKALTSIYIETNTHVEFEQNTNEPVLWFEWDEVGAQLSEQITSELIGKQLGIFFGNEPLLGEDGEPIAPIVQAVINEAGVIVGLSLDEATELSNLLNAGRMPVSLEIVSCQELGAD